MPDALKIAQTAADTIYAHNGLKINPELFLAQMRHETGNFSVIDKALAAAHNWAGMSTSKPTSLPRSPKEGGYYKEYESDEEFAADWASNFNKYADYWLDNGGSTEINDPDTFVDFLIADPNYPYFDTKEDPGGATYRASMAGLMGESYTDLLSHKGAWGTKGAYNLTTPPEKAKEPSLWEEIQDKFVAALVDNGVTSAFRTLGANIAEASSFKDLPLLNDYKPTDIDIKLVQDTLKDDPVAQNYVLTQATSREALLHLLENKQEDIARQEAVDNMDYGLSTAATIAGSMLDPTLLLAVIPGLGETVGAAKGAQLLAKLGKARAALSMGKVALDSSKAARFAAKALTTSMGVGAERWMAKEYGGFQPHYEECMTLGALAGGLSTLIGKAKKRNPALKNSSDDSNFIHEIEKTQDRIENNAAAIATGAVPPSEVRFNMMGTLATEMKNAFKGAQQKTSLVDLVPPGSLTEKLVRNGNVFIIGEKFARGIAKKFGIELAEDAKAFNLPKMGISVIMKEKVGKDNIEGVVAHEVAVHQSLKEFLGEAKYKQVMAVVSDRMKNSKDARWIAAAKNADDPEDALAYYIEQGASKKQGVVKSLIDTFASRLSKDGKVDKQLRDTVYEILKRRAKETLAKKELVQTLPDGSHIVGDIHYSKNNLFGTIFDEVSDMGRHAEALQSVENNSVLNHFLKKAIFGTFFEHGILGNFYGILANSHSPYMQRMAAILFNDPRMRSKEYHYLDASTIKKNLYDRFMQQYYDFAKVRTQYILDNYGVIKNKWSRNSCIKAVSEQIILCHDAMMRHDTVALKNFDPEIQKMAKMQADLRADIIEQLKKESEALGGRLELGSLIEKDWMPITNCFYRVTDDDKRFQWLTRNFKTTKKATDFLKEYALTFMDKDAEFEFYLKKHEKAHKEAVAKWSKEGKNGAKPEYVTPTLEDAEVKEFFEQEAENWAYGMIDRNRSILKFDKTKEGNVIDPFKHRVAIDTSGVINMPNGIPFSYDKDLRNFDMDSYVPQIMNRLTGEAALHAVLGDKKMQEAEFDAIRQQIAKNDTRSSIGKRELEALKMGLDKILGRGDYDEYDRRWGKALSSALRGLSYSIVGGNMAFSQLGELLGMAAYGGAKAITNVLPKSIMNSIRTQRLGKTKGEIIDRVTHSLYAEEIGMRAFDLTSSTDSRVWRQILDSKGWGRGFDTVNSLIKKATLATNMINFMPKLTNAMQMAMRKAAIEDTLYWAEGKNMQSRIRNPFSKQKLAAVGIKSESEAERLRESIKRYLCDFKGDVDKWATEDPDNFYLWKQLVDNESYRGIQQQTVGNQTPFKDKHTLIFQYKDFTLQAMNGQFMRALQSGERDDYAAFVFSALSNAGTYAALTYLKAWAYYGNDEEKRQKYIDENLKGWKPIIMGITRSSLLAPISFGMDAIEALTGYSFARTTVDNMDQPTETFMEKLNKAWGNDKAYTERLGQMVRQLPAISAPITVAQGLNSDARLAASKLGWADPNQEDISKAIKGFPALGSHLGAAAIATLVKSYFNLPTKEEQQKQQQKVKKTSNITAKKDNKTAKLLYKKEGAKGNGKKINKLLYNKGKDDRK